MMAVCVGRRALAIDIEDISWPDRSILIQGKGVNPNIKLVESVQLSWWHSVFSAFFVCCSSRFTGQTSHLLF
jgi:hypothetical protein